MSRIGIVAICKADTEQKTVHGVFYAHLIIKKIKYTNIKTTKTII